MKLEAPFIPLPLRFDVARLAHELALLESAQWRLHPDKTNGNSALPLISAGGGDNDDATGDMGDAEMALGARPAPPCRLRAPFAPPASSNG